MPFLKQKEDHLYEAKINEVQGNILVVPNINFCCIGCDSVDFAALPEIVEIRALPLMFENINPVVVHFIKENFMVYQWWI